MALQAFRMFSKVFLCLAAFSLTFSQVNITDHFLRNSWVRQAFKNVPNAPLAFWGMLNYTRKKVCLNLCQYVYHSKSLCSNMRCTCRSVEGGPVTLSRCSCCEVRSPSSWTTSSATPHSTNLCPSSTFSSQIDLCLGPLSTDWQEQVGGKASKNECL